ncbi:hypothetical protein [Vibrio scophthalmi]|uniref:Uncharacterized protein n=1 Tax=Vibrio scophthalmi TaxID=45658 RepID=A0A1E3WJ06_9VIBR|nr:hypothetical protein [Vibrio scophthalmi]ODS09741.1 hypothetical protein VSF3289_03203 [Vibrio scophthalmi]
MKRIIQQFKNYRLIVREFKLGLWTFIGEHYGWDGRFSVSKAKRITDGLTLDVDTWDQKVHVENRPWELGIFSSFLYLALRKQIRRTEKELRKEPRNLDSKIYLTMRATDEDIERLRQLIKTSKSSLMPIPPITNGD